LPKNVVIAVHCADTGLTPVRGAASRETCSRRVEAGERDAFGVVAYALQELTRLAVMSAEVLVVAGLSILMSPDRRSAKEFR
jgi:hypothetical protein